jgi:Fe-S cluster biosynthesis and repair protein YggX
MENFDSRRRIAAGSDDRLREHGQISFFHRRSPAECSHLPPPPAALRVCDNFLTPQAMSEHIVFCAKLKRELPGLPEPPFDTDLGKKVYETISQEAWNQWTEYCKMLLNEYRLNPARKQDQEVIVKQMEQFLFGEGAAPPKEYVPPTH